jgi:hypothetical protein
MNVLVYLLLAAVPFANGTSTLMAKLDSAYCTGNLTINLISATCLDRCTFGSEVYLVAQGEKLSQTEDSDCSVLVCWFKIPNQPLTTVAFS